MQATQVNPELEFLKVFFGSRFLGLNSSLLRLEFLPGFPPSFFHATKYYSKIDSMWMRSSLVSNAEVATVLGSIPASSDTVEFEGRQMKQC